MRRAAAIFLSLILCVFNAAAQIDSLKIRELDTRLGHYFSILESESADVKSGECDALIEAAENPEVRKLIALKIYDHYSNSPLMGDEAVAIHLTDKWFSTGKIEMRSEKELLDAKLFAEFNRQSLIGMKAPEVTLQDPFGASVTIPVILSEAKDRFRVLYFYDTDCAKCKLETAMLRSLMKDKDYPVDVIAIYVGRDEDGWKRWRESTFVLKSGRTRVTHLWDPDGLSDYQMKYGVTVTPRMFLVSPDWVIVGRALDTVALEKLLDLFLKDKEYDYGSEESFALFDELFSTYGAVVSPEDVSDLASLLRERTLAKGDTLSYKRLEGDLLYYLAAKKTEGFKEGTSSFVKDYILSKPDIWNTSDDSLKVVGLAGMLDGLLSKAPVGSVIPKSRVRGWNKIRRKGGYILFSSEGCPICKAELGAANHFGLNPLLVNMDALERNSPAVAKEFLDFFDLSSLPYIIETGKKGVIKRRYVSLVERLLYLN